MGRKMSRLRAHKLSVKAEAQRAKRRGRRDAAYEADMGEARRPPKPEHMPRTRRDAPAPSLPKRRTRTVDDRTTGALVKRLLGDMALDNEEAALASVQLAATSTASKRPRSGQDEDGREGKRVKADRASTAASTKATTRKTRLEAPTAASTSRFAIRLEGDGNEEDEDMSREVAQTASRFFAKLRPSQQTNFWTLRDVAQGNASAAGSAKQKKKQQQQQQARAGDVTGATKAKRKRAATEDEQDDLSFAHLMRGAESFKTASAASANRHCRDDDENDEEADESDRDDASSSGHSDSSSEPSWIPESDDDMEESGDEEDEEDEEDADSESSEEDEEEEELPHKAAPAKTKGSHKSPAPPAGKAAKNKPTPPPSGDHVTVHSQQGRGGRLFGLEEGDDTWDD